MKAVERGAVTRAAAGKAAERAALVLENGVNESVWWFDQRAVSVENANHVMDMVHDSLYARKLELVKANREKNGEDAGAAFARLSEAERVELERVWRAVDKQETWREYEELEEKSREKRMEVEDRIAEVLKGKDLGGEIKGLVQKWVDLKLLSNEYKEMRVFTISTLFFQPDKTELKTWHEDVFKELEYYKAFGALDGVRRVEF